jgi:predicted transcriptional regulator
MRTSRTLSITLPPAMLAQAEEIARKEHRTMSELIREALRHYERRQWWSEINAYGRKTAENAGVDSEEALVKAVHELRRKPPQPRRSRPRG